jgi:hypothetical protein
MRHRLRQQPGRFRRLGAVARQDFEIAEAAQVPGDVAARRLVGRGHRDAKFIVLDVEEHRQLLSGRDRQRGPESVGRTDLAAEHDRDRFLCARS